MNRRQKIIVSVTGIFLVLLILVGLTYAFFVTRIRGNNNPTSISVTTANLELVYQDNDSSIIGEGKILEPNSTTPIGEKTFTVTNNGNATIDNYAVIIENLAVKYVETQTVDGVEQREGEVTNFINGEDGNPDMKLVITCESSVEGKTCNRMDGYLPEKSGILLTNSIDEDEVHTYKATLTYLEDGTNQSEDMNKTIEGRFNIIDTNNTVDIEGTVTGYTKGDFVQINSEEKESVIYSDGTYKFVGVKPDNHKITVRYRENGEEKLRGSEPTTNISIVKGESAGVEGNTITITDLSRTVKIDVNATTNAPTIDSDIKDYSQFNEGTLAYEIYNNAKNATGNATVLSDPITLPITSISGENERILSSIADADGTSYFFRGNVVDNYVTFSNMCWRIVRIQGDKTVKLILEDETATCENSTTTENNQMCFGTDEGYDEFMCFTTNYYDSETELNNWITNQTTSSTGPIFRATRNFDSNKLALVSKGVDTFVEGDSGTGFIEPFTYDFHNKRILRGEPSLESENDKVISLITADEVVLAGALYEQTNSTYYLKNYNTPTSTIYARVHMPDMPDGFLERTNFGIENNTIKENSGMQNGLSTANLLYTPVIALKENVPFETNTTNNGIIGSKTNPYVIK